jgi:acylphosphatase
VRRVHCIVRGRVQGVAFRAYTVREARRLGLAGWVRNLPNGCVELVAQGEQRDLETLEAWCHQGPPRASVSDVETQWLDSAGDLGPFSVRYG